MDKTTLLHFNDIYNCEKAPRFVTKLKESWKDSESKGRHLYTIFSGDGISPSIASTILRGKQMIPILNAMKIDAACLGNHDLDFGLSEYEAIRRETNFPWLCSNACLVADGLPLGGCDEYAIIQKDNGGPRVLVVGLIESEWMETLATIDPSEVEYEDFVDYCKRRIPEITEKEGPFDLVIAATHMRMPNDYRLADECAGLIDIVLGGHDHHYEDTVHNHIHVLNSGTDFKDYSLLHLDGRQEQGDQDFKPLKVTAERVTIDKDTEEDPYILDSIRDVKEHIEKSMGIKVGTTKVDLDARFASIRTMETNVSNFIAALMTRSTGADVAILNAGTIRADRIVPEGEIIMKDLCDLFPMPDEVAVVELTADRLLSALENGVSKYPAMEGRFPCVDGVRFKFDPSKPPGSRIVPGSVYVRDRVEHGHSKLHYKGEEAKEEPQPDDDNASKEGIGNSDDDNVLAGFSLLDPNKTYTVVSKAYLITGKDGYEGAFVGAPVLMEAELCNVLPLILRNVFTELMVLKRWQGVMGYTGAVLKAASAFKTSVSLQGTVDPYAIKPIVDGRITNIQAEQK